MNLVDSSLEAAARDSLGLTAGPQGKGPDPITCQDALDLVVLDGFGRGIHSLEGIQSFENLQIVDLFLQLSKRRDSAGFPDPDLDSGSGAKTGSLKLVPWRD